MTNRSHWPNVDRHWTLFLDRDGVINQRPPGDYVKNLAEFRWLPGVLESMSVLGKTFGRIIIVTNQQGVGLGLMSAQALETIHQYLREAVSNAGGRIDAILSCTMLRGAPDNCRKPGLYMAYQAKALFPEIDFGKSVMVGDTESDMQFGKNAGMITVLIGDEKTGLVPDFSFASLAGFAAHIQNLAAE